jgi:hypothetical protein
MGQRWGGAHPRRRLSGRWLMELLSRCWHLFWAVFRAGGDRVRRLRLSGGLTAAARAARVRSGYRLGVDRDQRRPASAPSRASAPCCSRSADWISSGFVARLRNRELVVAGIRQPIPTVSSCDRFGWRAAVRPEDRQRQGCAQGGHAGVTAAPRSGRLVGRRIQPKRGLYLQGLAEVCRQARC